LEDEMQLTLEAWQRLNVFGRAYILKLASSDCMRFQL